MSARDNFTEMHDLAHYGRVLHTLLEAIPGTTEYVDTGFYRNELRKTYKLRREFEDSQNVGKEPGTSRCDWSPIFCRYGDPVMDAAWRVYQVEKSVKEAA